MSLIENPTSTLRWEVYGDLFGRSTLVASFLTEDLARSWMRSKAAAVFRG